MFRFRLAARARLPTTWAQRRYPEVDPCYGRTHRRWGRWGATTEVSSRSPQVSVTKTADKCRTNGNRLYTDAGYMSSPERGSRPQYEDPYYAQYAARSGSITPVIDEEARSVLAPRSFLRFFTISSHAHATTARHAY